MGNTNADNAKVFDVGGGQMIHVSGTGDQTKVTYSDGSPVRTMGPKPTKSAKEREDTSSHTENPK